MRKILFLGLLWLLPSAAEARPRDEVMSGVYRCATISDSRRWLDCDYVVAQQARAQLGLPPLLASHIQPSSLMAPVAATICRSRVVAARFSRCGRSSNKPPKRGNGKCWFACHLC